MARSRKTLPAPPVPADANMKGYPAFLLDTDALVESDLTINETAETFKISVLSWCLAWKQIPAGSLPNDDRKLAWMFRFGSDAEAIAKWKAARAAGALYKWYEASDGRLYHPVVASKVLDAIATRAAQKNRTAAARAHRYNGSTPPGGKPLDIVEKGISVTENATENVTGNVTGSVRPLSRVSGLSVTSSNMNLKKKEEEDSLSQTQYSVCARGEGVQPKGADHTPLPEPIPEPAPRPPPSPPPLRGYMPCRSSPPRHWIVLAGAETMLDDSPHKGGVVAGVFLHEAAELVCQAARIEDPDWRCDWRPLKAWLVDGFDLTRHILPAIEWKAKREDYEPVRSLMAFDGLIRNWRAERTA